MAVGSRKGIMHAASFAILFKPQERLQEGTMVEWQGTLHQGSSVSQHYIFP